MDRFKDLLSVSALGAFKALGTFKALGAFIRRNTVLRICLSIPDFTQQYKSVISTDISTKISKYHALGTYDKSDEKSIRVVTTNPDTPRYDTGLEQS